MFYDIFAYLKLFILIFVMHKILFFICMASKRIYFLFYNLNILRNSYRIFFFIILTSNLYTTQSVMTLTIPDTRGQLFLLLYNLT